MKKRLTAAVLCLFLLTSCDFVISDPEALLRPPTLNTQQAEVYEALESTLNIADIDYKYPQRGDHRSPFVLFDIDGDGREEAVIFYSYKNTPSTTWTKILLKDDTGAWFPLRDFPAAYDQVDFIQFSNLLTPDAHCMIIGWQNSGAQSLRNAGSALGIYSLSGGEFVTEVPEHSYLDYTIQDFDGNGLEEIVLVERERDSGHLMLSLLRGVGQHIGVTDTVALNREADTLLQLITGRLWDGGIGVYIDQVRLDTSVATEVVRVGAAGMSTLVGGPVLESLSPESEEQASPEQTAMDNYRATFRDDPFLSRDYNGDGEIEIPYPRALPGNLQQGEDTPLMLLWLMQLGAQGFVVNEHAVLNEKEGYLVFLPEKWMDAVSVQRGDDDAEWRFFLLDENGDAMTELLRIQAVDSGEALSSPGTIELGSRGARLFTGYIPLTTDDAPSITDDELKTMFRLLQ